MVFSRRSIAQLVVLAVVAQIGFSQHWSYGWMPGGKRNAGKPEDTFKMMDCGHLVVLSEESNSHTLRRLGPFDSVNEESSELMLKHKWRPHER